MTLGVRLKGTHMSFFSHLETFLPSHGNTRESGVAWQVSLEINGKQREKKTENRKKNMERIELLVITYIFLSTIAVDIYNKRCGT